MLHFDYLCSFSVSTFKFQPDFVMSESLRRSWYVFYVIMFISTDKIKLKISRGL